MKKLLFFALAIALALGVSCAPPPEQIENTVANTDTWTESNRQLYLESMYLYENLRPSESMTDGRLEASADEQLLRLIDARYKDVDEELYMPLADEIQYEEIKRIVPLMAETLDIADRTPDLCYSFFTRSSSSEIEQDPMWITALIYEDGYHYWLVVNANDGSFLKWTRYPQGYWTYLQPNTISLQEPFKERTDEELLSVAETYAESVLLTIAGSDEIVESTTVITAVSPDVKKYVSVVLHPYKVYNIYIDYDDLSVVSVAREIRY